MALIYSKTVSDKTLILSPREYFMRPIDFGTDWTEVRVGMFFGGVTSAGDNTQSVSETVVVSSVADRIAFGLKNSSSATLPGLAGSQFLGVTTANTRNSECNGQDFQATTSGLLAAVGWDGVTQYGGTTSEEMTPSLSYGAGVANATGYCGFFAVKFVVNDIGLATQTISISSAHANGAVSGSDYSADTLLTGATNSMNNASYSTAEVIQWNDGANALPLPDAVWLRVPFYNNRIRVSCIQAVRYAP